MAAEGSELAPGGGGVLVVVSAGDDTLRIGEHAVAVSALPESVALSSDARRVAVAAALGGSVDVVDAQGAPLMQVAVGGRPVRVLYGPSGGDGGEPLAVAPPLLRRRAGGRGRLGAPGRGRRCAGRLASTPAAGSCSRRPLRRGS